MGSRVAVGGFGGLAEEWEWKCDETQRVLDSQLIGNKY